MLFGEKISASTNNDIPIVLRMNCAVSRAILYGTIFEIPRNNFAISTYLGDVIQNFRNNDERKIENIPFKHRISRIADNLNRKLYTPAKFLSQSLVSGTVLLTS